MLPFLGELGSTGLARKLKRLSKILDKFLEKIIDEHEQALGSNREEQKPHRNFVLVIVSLLNKPMNPHDKEQEFIIGRTNIKAIMLDMIVAALDTSTTTIEWALSELLRHPRVMFGLQQELETVVGRSKMVEESDLPKLTYLDMVVKESLRLHPVAPFLVPHESMEDIMIDGYFIPKKSQIIVNTWSIGRDPDVWSNNAEEFFPERFIDNNIDLRGHEFQLTPFGSSRRGCPGMQLGPITVHLILAQLVHCFDWELPVELDMSEKFGHSMPRANPLLVKATYRLLDKRM
ncbi:Cytochrome P450 [Theobroma cacao]|uniref:Cytochrome P450 n=1 Tax=Theobroma cacao TaxID=3641 RepID=A0A061G1T2_THECC|nr:Cytochrome P450 [Theobroma cacao]